MFAKPSLPIKTCLLTGATGGIGAAIAKRLSEQGYELILQGRNIEKLKQLQLSLPRKSYLAPGDMTKADDRESVVKESMSHGPIDLLVNAAGISAFRDFTAHSDDLISQLIRTNVEAPIMLTRLILQRQQEHPITVVNVGSTLGSIGFPGFSVYSATKFALRGFTEALAREFSNSHARVVYFAPRTTRTAINSSSADAMNDALGNAVDSPDLVAQEFMNLLNSSKPRGFVGWPEKLFVRINGVLPNLVDKAIVGKLSTIKKYSVLEVSNENL